MFPGAGSPNGEGKRGIIIAIDRFRSRLSRRSFLFRVTGGASLALGAGAVLTGCKDPEGEDGAAGLTDCDQGSEADPAGSGRTGNSTGVSDSDQGANADPAGCGRGGGSITDSDRGRFADPGGQGRGPERHTDRDTGFGADPIGRGRGGGSVESVQDGDEK